MVSIQLISEALEFRGERSASASYIMEVEQLWVRWLELQIYSVIDVIVFEKGDNRRIHTRRALIHVLQSSALAYDRVAAE